MVFLHCPRPTPKPRPRPRQRLRTMELGSMIIFESVYTDPIPIPMQISIGSGHIFIGIDLRQRK